MKKTRKIQYSWEDFRNDIEKLVEVYFPLRSHFKNIYGIPRGGLIPAVVLSHRLKIPMIFDKKKISKYTLIVDDISDSGETLMKLLKGKKYNVSVITLWTTLTTKRVPDLLLNVVKDNDWIIFPWEDLKGPMKKDT